MTAANASTRASIATSATRGRSSGAVRTMSSLSSEVYGRMHALAVFGAEGQGLLENNVDQFSRLDMTFHYEFLALCPNPYLRSAYELIRYQLVALRYRSPISCLK